MSLLQPWIQDYVIDIAEQLGTDYFNAPLHKKSKTVQIIEFFHRGSEGQDTNVWARVSDSSRCITIKFTPEAAAEYLNSSQNIRLTQHQTAIIRIKNFKLFLGRVAVGENKMTANSTLALECTCAAPYGSFDEKKIGNPLDITTHPVIRVWIEGLRQGGGSGNILKEKRIERERQQPAAEVGQKGSAPGLEQQKLDTIVHRPIVKRASRTKFVKASAVVDLASTSRSAWRPKMPSFYEVPPELLAALRALPIEGGGAHASLKRDDNDGNDESGEGPRKRNRTEHDNEEQDGMDVDIEDVEARSSQPLSDWSSSDRGEQPPTPGQRQPPSPAQAHTSSPDGQKPSQQGSVSRCSHSQKVGSSSLGPPPMSSYLKPEGFLSGGSVEERAASQGPRSRVLRRVPPPKQPQEPMQSSGPERILVPASDTSMSQSQSQGVQEGTQRTKNPGSSPMRELMEEETTWLQNTQEMVQKAPSRQLARKTAYKIPVNVEKVKTHEILTDGGGMSEDDEETNKRVFIQMDGKGSGVEKVRKDMGKLPPSKEVDNNNDQASANGRNAGVSTSTTAVTGVETPGQHEPKTWKQPSFMKRKGRLKLGGFTVRLTGLRKGGGENMAWLSWGELQRILGET